MASSFKSNGNELAKRECTPSVIHGGDRVKERSHCTEVVGTKDWAQTEVIRHWRLFILQDDVTRLCECGLLREDMRLRLRDQFTSGVQQEAGRHGMST